MEEEKKTIEMRRRREGGKKWKEKEERKKIEIHHFYINHNATCLLPQFCINIVFDFSRDDCTTQGKFEMMVMPIFWGGGWGGGGNKMHYGLCENGE